MKNLQLSLKKEWFYMTKSGVKTEDYRELTPYFAKRLLDFDFTQEQLEGFIFEEFMTDLWHVCKDTSRKRFRTLDECFLFFSVEFKHFKNNIMTLGYPKKGDPERTLIYKNSGISIGYGKTEWGAKEGVLYFIIKHGERS